MIELTDLVIVREIHSSIDGSAKCLTFSSWGKSIILISQPVFSPVQMFLYSASRPYCQSHSSFITISSQLADGVVVVAGGGGAVVVVVVVVLVVVVFFVVVVVIVVVVVGGDVDVDLVVVSGSN